MIFVSHLYICVVKNIKDDGAATLGLAIEKNKTIKIINLGCKKIFCMFTKIDGFWLNEIFLKLFL